MSTTIPYGYDYVFDLASRLSPKEQKRLLRELPTAALPQPEERQEPWLTDECIKQPGIPKGEPLISREEIEEIKRRVANRSVRRTPEEIEANRQKLLEILLNCPVMSEEELQGIIDARKEINECRLAYL